MLDPSFDEGDALGIDDLGAERWHALERIAGSHARGDDARIGASRLDALRRVPCATHETGSAGRSAIAAHAQGFARDRQPAGPARGRPLPPRRRRCGSARSCRADSRARRVRSAWLRRCVATRRASAAGGCGSSLATRARADPIRRALGLRVRCKRIAVRRELQRGESEHRYRRAFVAGDAVDPRWNRVTATGRLGDGYGRTVFRREYRVGSLRIPDVRRVAPRSVRETFDEPSLDGAVVTELLPQARARREFERVRTRCIDRGALRQADPPALRGAIGPQRVLRRERNTLAWTTIVDPSTCRPVSRRCVGSDVDRVAPRSAGGSVADQRQPRWLHPMREAEAEAAAAARMARGRNIAGPWRAGGGSINGSAAGPCSARASRANDMSPG